MMNCELGCLYGYDEGSQTAIVKMKPVDVNFSFCLYPYIRRKHPSIFSKKQKNIRVQTSFHHGKQHGFVSSVGKCYTCQN